MPITKLSKSGKRLPLIGFVFSVSVLFSCGLLNKAVSPALLATAVVEPSPAATLVATATGTATATNIPESSPTPCISSSAIAPERISDIKLYFYCGTTGHQHDLVMEYVQHALDADLPGVSMKGEVYVFTDMEQAATVRLRWLRAQGYHFYTYEMVLNDVDADCGIADKGALFLFFRKKCWSDSTDLPNEQLILHEMHHLLQNELSGLSDYAFPVWLQEGGAEFFAWQELNALHGSDLHVLAPSKKCDFPLSALVKWKEPAADICTYLEGQHAVALLVQSFGESRYYELFRRLGSGQDFKRIFHEVYGISADEFYQVFDQYRKSGYTISPDFIPPTATTMP